MWQVYNEKNWSISDVNSGNYAAFVYLIEFESTFYIGVKQVYKGIKDAKRIRDDSKESNWVTYTSSSRTVNEMIGNDEPYRKSVLYCFPTVNQAVVVEATLIGLMGSRSDCLNKAIMCKARLPKDNGNTFTIIQELIEVLS